LREVIPVRSRVACRLWKPCCLPRNRQPPPSGMFPKLGDVDVDQLARPGAFVATCWLTGDSIDVGKPVESATDQDGVHRRGRHRELGPDLNRPQSPFPAQVHDLANHRGGGLGVLGVPRRGPIAHPGRAFLAVALGPLRRGAPGDVEELSRPRRRPTLLDDQPRQPQTMFRSQSRVSVSHEGLPVEWVLDSSTPHRGGLHLSTARRTRSHNVPGHHI
jgi:hypothetical protein